MVPNRVLFDPQPSISVIFYGIPPFASDSPLPRFTKGKGEKHRKSIRPRFVCSFSNVHKHHEWLPQLQLQKSKLFPFGPSPEIKYPKLLPKKPAIKQGVKYRATIPETCQHDWAWLNISAKNKLQNRSNQILKRWKKSLKLLKTTGKKIILHLSLFSSFKPIQSVFTRFANHLPTTSPPPSSRPFVALLLGDVVEDVRLGQNPPEVALLGDHASAECSAREAFLLSMYVS